MLDTTVFGRLGLLNSTASSIDLRKILKSRPNYLGATAWKSCDPSTVLSPAQYDFVCHSTWPIKQTNKSSIVEPIMRKPTSDWPHLHFKPSSNCAALIGGAAVAVWKSAMEFPLLSQSFS